MPIHFIQKHYHNLSYIIVSEPPVFIEQGNETKYFSDIYEQKKIIYEHRYVQNPFKVNVLKTVKTQRSEEIEQYDKCDCELEEILTCDS